MESSASFRGDAMSVRAARNPARLTSPASIPTSLRYELYQCCGQRERSACTLCCRPVSAPRLAAFFTLLGSAATAAEGGVA